jgi:GGDEF domain-containing protein
MSREDFESESALVRKQIEQTAIPDYIPDLAAPMTCQGVLYGVVCLSDIPRGTSLVSERVRAISNVAASAFENIRLLERFETAADLDMDTGLPGPSQLQQKLESELERFRRFSSPLALIEARIPNAAVADRFLGREIMRMSATYLKNTMRNIDIGVKISADTILLLLPGTDLEGCSMVVSRLGQAMPELSDEEGDRVGSVELRSIALDPSEGNITADDVMDRLGQQTFRHFGS